MTARQLFGSFYLASQLRGQTRFAFRPLFALQSEQSRRVRAMVAYAYRYIPFYRETLNRLQLTPADFRTAADLARLPILETEQYQRDPDMFLSTAAPREAYLDLTTSGSTGLRRTIYHDWRGVAQNAAHAERERALVAELLGHPRHYREAVFAMSFDESTPFRVPGMLREHVWIPRSVGIERLYLRVLDPLPENVARLNEFRPDVLHANGSHLAELFGYLRKTGAEFYRPRVVTYGSEGVSDAVRRLIMEEFGLPVLSAYQTTEAFKLGFECDQHRGYHMNLDLYPVRLVDPQDRLVPVGETGEVIVSNLVNRATVLFNYRLNDLASWLPDACPCGRTLPMLSFLQGRGRDFLRFDTGKLVHPRALDQLLTHEPGIWQYQVVQRSGSRVEVDLVVAPDLPREPTRERLAADLGALCGEGVQVAVEFPEALPRTPGGKIRPVVALRDAEAELLGEENR